MALLVGSVCRAQPPEAVRILGVAPGASGALELRLSCPASLYGSAWQIYRCNPAERDDATLWKPMGSPVTLSEPEQRVPLSSAEEAVSFFLVKRTDQPGEPQVLRLSRVPSPDGTAALVRVEALDSTQSSILFETGFETDEGYRMGAVTSPEAGWGVVGEVVIASAPENASQAIRLSGPDARLSRVLETGEKAVRVEYALYVSTTGVVQSVRQPERPPKRSSSIAYHPGNGFLAFDGDGSGGGRWVLIPESTFFDQWVTVAIDLDYNAKRWSIRLNNIARLDSLGFTDAELESFREMHLYPGNTGEMYVDDVRVVQRVAESEELQD